MAEIQHLKKKRTREATPPAEEAGERRSLLSDVEAVRPAQMTTPPREDQCPEKKKKKKKKKKKDTRDERVPPLVQQDADPRRRETGEPEQPELRPPVDWHASRKRQREEGEDDHLLVDVSPKKKKKKRREDESGVTELRSQLGHADPPADETELERQIAELEEFIPKIRQYTAHDIRKHMRYDLLRLRHFKKQGVPIRTGRFSQKENNQISENVARFLEVTGLESSEQLLFPHRFGELQHHIRKVKRRHCFMMAIAEGIPRLCKHIINRAHKIDHMNHNGCFTKEEVAKLCYLHSIHGNSWSIIAGKMDRSNYAVQKRFVHISTAEGPWMSDEKRRLKEGVRAHLDGTRAWGSPAPPGDGSEPPDYLRDLRRVCTNLPWMAISRHVGTRNWTQCRNKWFGILSKALTPKESRKKAHLLKKRIKLINTLYASNVEEARDVDWDLVASNMRGETSFSVQKIFHQLKASHVPNWWRRTYGEIIDFLQEQVVPRLKDQQHLYRQPKDPEQDRDEPTSHLYATLAHIFASDDNVFAEVDNTPAVVAPSVAPSAASDAGLL
ncbi:transcription termination factor 1-like [Stigmatopora nigra]